MKTVTKLILSACLTDSISAIFADEGVKPWPEIEIPDSFQANLTQYSVKTGKFTKTKTKFVYYYDSKNDRERL